jgi:type I restriction enzyme R subunit
MSPADVNEKTIQNGVAKHIESLGWKLADDETLSRPVDGIFLYDDLEAALVRLNPEIAEQPERAQEVFAKLRAVVLAVRNDGLVAANEEFVQWMCGRRSIQYIGTDKSVQVRMIDFDDVRSNILRTTTEATFHVGNEHRR